MLQEGSIQSALRLINQMLRSRRAITCTLSVFVAGCFNLRALLASMRQPIHRLSLESQQVSTESPESHMFPLIIGTGQGTTGTKSIHLIMCSLGVPSVHFHQVCHRGSENSTAFHGSEIGAKAHKQVMKIWKELRSCIAYARNQSTVCDNSLELISELRERVEAVVTSGVGAVHDTPYTFMTPYIIKLARDIRGREPVLLLTERGPQQWAARRVDRHKITPQIVCDDVRGGFDLDYCLKTDPNATNILKSYTDCREKEEQDEYIELLEKAMASYQNSMRQLSPAYQVNMFETNKKMDIENMAQSIWNNIRSQLPSLAVDELITLRSAGGLENEIVYDKITSGKKKKRPWPAGGDPARKQQQSLYNRIATNNEQMNRVHRQYRNRASRKQGSFKTAGTLKRMEEVSQY